MGKNIILGTAGHIDHGKTTLIKALTGTNTDRLPEEQSRGITIELGFAHMVLDDGTQVGIVDVPGHEKFVHHMVAGVGGMDIVMLVIAADEGIMPQTREHLSICQLLGVKKGIVALTKTDMVDSEWFGLVQEDVSDYLLDSFLEQAEMIPVSAITGQGIPKLKKAIAAMAATTESKQSAGPFRLPIDRVFTIKGFGTVVTGTVASGSIKHTDPLIIQPGNHDVRIRGLQVHGLDASEVSAGQRAAINLQNLDRNQMKRGMMLTQPATMHESYMLDAKLQLIDSLEKPLKNRAPIRLHTGTAEILGRVVLMDRDVLSPGDEAFVQFRLQSPTANLPGDRYIIRSYSPVQTIGGGEILDAEPRKHKRLKPETIDHFKALASDDPTQRLLAWLDNASIAGFDKADLMRRFPDPQINTQSLIKPLINKKRLLWLSDAPNNIVSRLVMNSYHEKVLHVLAQWHNKFPLKVGVSREAIRTMLKPQPALNILSSVIRDMVSNGLVIEIDHLVCHPEFSVTLTKDQEVIRTHIIEELKKAGASGQTVKALQDTLKSTASNMKPVIQYMLESKEFVRTPNGMVFSSDTIQSLENLLRNLANTPEGITVGQFRDAAGISRKQAVPLLEYFDSIGFTRRQGDKRIIR